MSEQAPTPESQDTEGTSSVIAAEQAEVAAQPAADLHSAQEADDARAADEALEEAAAEEADEAPAEPQTRESDADGDVLPEDSADPVQAFKDELAGKFGDWYVIHTYAGYSPRRCG